MTKKILISILLKDTCTLSNSFDNFVNLNESANLNFGVKTFSESRISNNKLAVNITFSNYISEVCPSASIHTETNFYM